MASSPARLQRGSAGLALAATLAACGANVGIQDVAPGSGAEARDGAKVQVHYTGWLEDGTQFATSREGRGRPATFLLGTGAVIRGWDLGIRGMKVGGKRRLTIPPSLGYGAEGSGKGVPPDATLTFEVELVAVE